MNYFNSRKFEQIFGRTLAKRAESAYSANRVENLHYSTDGDVSEASGKVYLNGRPCLCSIKLTSPTLLEGKCYCPLYANQGQICMHMATLFLATCESLNKEATLFSEKGKLEANCLETTKTECAKNAIIPYAIQFLDNWKELWEQASLPFRLIKRDGGQKCVGDKFLHDWLAKMGVKEQALPPMFVLKRGKIREDFFRGIIQHHKIFAGKSAISFLEGVPLLTLKATPIAKGYWRICLQNKQVQALFPFLWYEEDQTLYIPPTHNCPQGWDLSIWQKFWRLEPVDLPIEKIILVSSLLETLFNIQEGSVSALLKIEMPTPKICMKWAGNKQHLQFIAHFDYGAFSKPIPMIPSLPEDKLLVSPTGRYWKRNSFVETRFLLMLNKHPFQYVSNIWHLTGLKQVGEFLTSDFQDLVQRKDCHVMGTTEFREVCNQFVKVHVRLVTESISLGTLLNEQVASQLIFCDCHGTSYDSTEILSHYQKGEASFVTKEGKCLLFDREELFDVLNVIGKSMGKTHLKSNISGKISLSLADTISIDNATSELPPLAIPSSYSWDRILESLKTSCRIVLRNYQVDGVYWLWQRLLLGRGAVLADDMGLGKTLQTLATLFALRRVFPKENKSPILIVAPASLLYNWKEEIEKAFPEWDVSILHGVGREDVQIKEIGITSYALLMRDFARHYKAHYFAVVMDEASFIRNPETDAAQAAHRIPAQFKLALTGTPIENGVRDLWSIFQAVLPQYLGSHQEFKLRYEQPLSLNGFDPAIMRNFKRKISPWILRRLKSEVATELPEKITSLRYVELSDDYSSLYMNIHEYGRLRMQEALNNKQAQKARMEMMTVLLRLRQVCDEAQLLPEDLRQNKKWGRSPKVEETLFLLDELLANDHKVLVFSQFASMLALLGGELNRVGKRYLLLDGHTQHREELVKKFKSPDGPPIFLISLKAGGYGLNLQEADTVIHLDPWWNPAVEAQATDRAHRIGQNKSVSVYKMVCRGTVEEKIVELQKKKMGLNFAALGDQEPMMDSLSETELQQLLS